jgi:hypothetical protein
VKFPLIVDSGWLRGRPAGTHGPRRDDGLRAWGCSARWVRADGWPLTEYAGHDTPDGLRHPLNRPRRDADGFRDEAQAYVAERHETRQLPRAFT